MKHQKKIRAVKINTLQQFLDSVRKYERNGRKPSYYKKIKEAQTTARELIKKKYFTGKGEKSLRAIVKVKISLPLKKKN